MRILITGAAGFIGFHCSDRFVGAGHEVVGIDNLNPYYDVRLKRARLERLAGKSNFIFKLIDLADRPGMESLFKNGGFDIVLHLGAQAGVRYSIDNPFAYIDSNITGMLTVLEGCRHNGVRHLVYASSSSVYGENAKQPFSASDRTDAPVSLYAATKKADELMCQTYAHLYRFPVTGLRFFTVYGPWGRPDMAYFKFSDAIMDGRPIDVFNNGDMKRDFTYIDDVVDCVERIVEREPLASSDPTPHRVYNIGNNQPEQLLGMIKLLESTLGFPAKMNLLPMQPGDVQATYADIKTTHADLGFSPSTPLSEGLQRFSEWYLQYRSRRFAE